MMASIFFIASFLCDQTLYWQTLCWQALFGLGTPDRRVTRFCKQTIARAPMTGQGNVRRGLQSDVDSRYPAAKKGAVPKF